MNPEQPNTDPNEQVIASERRVIEDTLDTTVIAIIKRHPFGLVALYLQAIIGLGVAFGLILFLIPTLLDDVASQQARHLLLILGVVASAVTALFLVIATYVYRNNQWTVTDDSIQQLQQTGVFKRQTSELSMANIEDITSEQNGFLATAFGFGTLKVETAGERSNFHFQYCPKPNKYAQIILEARERYIENDPEQAKRANGLLNLPRTN